MNNRMESFDIPDDERLKIAVQKSGRLTDASLALMTRCGLNFARDRDRLICYGENLPVDLMLVRDDDIPELVGDGVCDAGIVGQNVATEFLLSRRDLPFAERRVLDYGRCRLALAVPVDAAVRTVTDLDGKRIATTYPRLTARFLEAQGITAETVVLKGAVEIAPRLGRADAICDMVSTGTTLRANRLREIATVEESRAVFVAGHRVASAGKRALIERILRRIDGVMQVNESKYIMLHAPRARLAEITRMLPGAESPTILQLEGSVDKVAVHAVCRESVFWETLEDLKSAGASAMLVLPVDKMLA